MDKDNTERGTSPLEVTNPSYEKSEELEVLNETHGLINLDSPNNHRKPELKRSISLGDKTETGLVTRSKVTDSFEHKELVFKKKKKKHEVKKNGYYKIRRRKVVVDISNNKVIINKSGTTSSHASQTTSVLGIETEETGNKIFTLKPRSETIVQLVIADPIVDFNSIIYIDKYIILSY